MFVNNTAWASGDAPAYLFHQGTNFRSYEFLGSHLKADGAKFRVWAPNAKSVSVIGDFNRWDGYANACSQNNGIWEADIPNVKQGDRYKYLIRTHNGQELKKADPYAFYSETDGKTASIAYDPDDYEWSDSVWLAKPRLVYDKPMNIYECHLGSWRRGADGEELSYRNTADILVPYLKDMSYTHLELLPVMEHPYEKSWGYQTTGYFAPTSRWGTPEDLMYLIDLCHQNDIGVILDWVPSHFPKDAFALASFDGEPLYECHGWDRIEQPQWGTRCFDYGRTEVQSFLISSAYFWLGYYHADGLRVDAVSSMLYLDYGRKAGEWQPNAYGDNKNLEAIAFIKKLNTAVFDAYPKALMIAEEASAYPMVTKPIHDGGLGFNYKWNMGWMNDMLEYTEIDPLYRKHKHNKITFSLFYAFSENFVLPISHDEVVHGKKSLLEKMPGDYRSKFAGFRAFLGYMFTHPGKKLNFMGTEFAQFIEWKDDDSLDWHLLDYPAHKEAFTFTRDLNRFYVDNPALWEQDYSWDGFNWISDNDSAQNIIIFTRTAANGDTLVIVQNFAPVERRNYRFGVPEAGTYTLAFNSDKAEYGGYGIDIAQARESEAIAMHGHQQSLNVTIPPLSTTIYQVK